MLQVAGDIAARVGEVLYVSAEESAQQVKLRAERLGIATDRACCCWPETDIDAIVETAEQRAARRSSSWTRSRPSPRRRSPPRPAASARCANAPCG